MMYRKLMLTLGRRDLASVYRKRWGVRYQKGEDRSEEQRRRGNGTHYQLDGDDQSSTNKLRGSGRVRVRVRVRELTRNSMVPMGLCVALHDQQCTYGDGDGDQQ